MKNRYGVPLAWVKRRESALISMYVLHKDCRERVPLASARKSARRWEGVSGHQPLGAVRKGSVLARGLGLTLFGRSWTRPKLVTEEPLSEPVSHDRVAGCRTVRPTTEAGLSRELCSTCNGKARHPTVTCQGIGRKGTLDSRTFMSLLSPPTTIMNDTDDGTVLIASVTGAESHRSSTVRDANVDALVRADRLRRCRLTPSSVFFSRPPCGKQNNRKSSKVQSSCQETTAGLQLSQNLGCPWKVKPFFRPDVMRFHARLECCRAQHSTVYCGRNDVSKLGNGKILHSFVFSKVSHSSWQWICKVCAS